MMYPKVLITLHYQGNHEMIPDLCVKAMYKPHEY